MKNKQLWAVIVNGERARLLPNPLQDDARALPPILLRSAGQKLRASIDKMQLTGFSEKSVRDTANAYRTGPMQNDMMTLAIRVNAALEFYRSLGMIGELVIFASPDMIEKLRQTLNSELRNLVVLERTVKYPHLSDDALLSVVGDALKETKKDLVTGQF